MTETPIKAFSADPEGRLGTVEPDWTYQSLEESSLDIPTWKPSGLQQLESQMLGSEAGAGGGAKVGANAEAWP